MPVALTTKSSHRSLVVVLLWPQTDHIAHTNQQKDPGAWRHAHQKTVSQVKSMKPDRPQVMLHHYCQYLRMNRPWMTYEETKDAI